MGQALISLGLDHSTSKTPASMVRPWVEEEWDPERRKTPRKQGTLSPGTHRGAWPVEAAAHPLYLSQSKVLRQLPCRGCGFSHITLLLDTGPAAPRVTPWRGALHTERTEFSHLCRHLGSTWECRLWEKEHRLSWCGLTRGSVWEDPEAGRMRTLMLPSAPRTQP